MLLLMLELPLSFPWTEDQELGIGETIGSLYVTFSPQD